MFGKQHAAVNSPGIRARLLETCGLLIFLASCAGSSTAQEALQAAEDRCDGQYPMVVGTMSPQAFCIKHAVQTYGRSAFSDDYALAVKMAEARVTLWDEADKRVISIQDAQSGLGAYGNRLVEQQDTDPYANGVGHRMRRSIVAGALYHY